MSGVSLVLDTEVVDWFVSWLITPITFLFCLGVFSLLFLASEVKPFFPSNSSGVVVPIDVSVNCDIRCESPEKPSSFPDHPHVGFTHVVRNVIDHNFVFERRVFAGHHDT